jgi:hypothetical protein
MVRSFTFVRKVNVSHADKENFPLTAPRSLNRDGSFRATLPFAYIPKTAANQVLLRGVKQVWRKFAPPLVRSPRSRHLLPAGQSRDFILAGGELFVASESRLA